METNEPNEESEVGEIEVDEVACEETTERVSRAVFDPIQPTARQISDHDRTHLPYRNWCKWCVLAKGREDGHPRDLGEQEGLPVVGMDYVYYGNDSKEGEEVVDKKVTTLITKDGKSGASLEMSASTRVHQMTGSSSGWRST